MAKKLVVEINLDDEAILGSKQGVFGLLAAAASALGGYPEKDLRDPTESIDGGTEPLEIWGFHGDEQTRLLYTARVVEGELENNFDSSRSHELTEDPFKGAQK